MRLANPGAEIYIPDGKPEMEALSRTTHLGVVAHEDDLEIACYDGILACFGRAEQWFGGVVATDGAGSPRDDLYAHYSDEEMRQVRRHEQKKAACVGEYGAQFLLDYSSSAVKDAAHHAVVEDLKRILETTRPATIYTHNPADKHDTHVAVALRLIQAIRELPAAARPQALYGCECWRDLDWLLDEEKVVFDVSAHENLAAALTGVFDSQICGGKRYDLATAGRRRAHATMFSAHATDIATAMIYAMELTPLIREPFPDIEGYVAGFISRFAENVAEKLRKLG